MKALSIQQPWAWAIAAGVKKVENRTWSTRYRGPLAIHAGKGRAYLRYDDRNAWLAMYGVAYPDDLVFGAVIAIGELVNVVEYANQPDPFAEGPYCWLLENVRPITPIPCLGKLGLFNVPDPVV